MNWYGLTFIYGQKRFQYSRKTAIPGVSEEDFLSGGPLRWPSKAHAITAASQRSHPLRNLLPNEKGELIVSGDVKEAIEKHGLRGFAFYPIQLISPRKKPIAQYWFLRFLESRPVLNLKASNYDRYEKDEPRAGDICAVWDYVLQPSALSGIDGVRCAEFSVAVFVSERFKQATERLKAFSFIGPVKIQA